MKVAGGRSVLEGIAIGPLHWFQPQRVQIPERSARTPEEELERLEQARRRAQAQLGGLYEKARKEAGADSAAIFQIHQMMLDDEDFLAAVRDPIRSRGVSAEYAVQAAGEHFAAALAAMEDAYMQARADDVRDVARRVVLLLAGEEERPVLREPVLLLADDLSPSETVQLDKSKLLGFVTRRGSVNSHTAILARTMGVPALMGVEVDPAWDGHMAALDGYSQRLYVDPSPELLSSLEARRRAGREQAALLQALREEPSVTLDGTEIQVCANIGGAAGLDLALQNGAQGIGLFRSEFLFLDRDRYPTEEEQFAAYRRAAEAMAGKPVVIRTLDIGADKRADYLGLEPEENPALGFRAIRVCLTRRELFKTQLRAILRASAYGSVSVMFPMIISLEEVREARKLLEECRRELLARGCVPGRVEVGIMVETPAAVLLADELAREVDFFSIGTNDLTQYTLAIDRQNPRLDPFYDPHHPAVLRMIQMTVEAGHRHGCWVGICGELGADLTLTETFLRMGVDELSVAPAAILPLRKKIRELDLGRT